MFVPFDMPCKCMKQHQDFHFLGFFCAVHDFCARTVNVTVERVVRPVSCLNLTS